MLSYIWCSLNSNFILQKYHVLYGIRLFVLLLNTQFWYLQSFLYQIQSKNQSQTFSNISVYIILYYVPLTKMVHKNNVQVETLLVFLLPNVRLDNVLEKLTYAKSISCLTWFTLNVLVRLLFCIGKFPSKGTTRMQNNNLTFVAWTAPETIKKHVYSYVGQSVILLFFPFVVKQLIRYCRQY